MRLLVAVAGWSALGFLTVLVAVVVARILTGAIPLRGLLSGDRSGGEYFSLGRTQLLVATFVVALKYLRNLADDSSLSMPDVPTIAVEFLGASQLFYLAGKARALWRPAPARSSQKGERS